MRVLVVSQNQLAQFGLGALVEQAEGLEVVAAVAPGGAADAVLRLRPDAILVDGGAGRSALRESLEAVADAHGVPILVLTDSAAAGAEALAGGAAALLSPDTGPAVLAAAVGAAVGGLVVFDRGLAEGLVSTPTDIDEALRPIERLTPRESQVLQLLAQGLTNAEIGSRLEVSEHTAKFHVGAVLGKLGARSRAEAVAVASRLGWITV
jgi:DNA-binding NarL/FixJ family response regulator